METSRNQNRGCFILIYNPSGVVDRDIYLSAQSGHFQVKSCEIEISRTPEGHTVEQLDLISLGKDLISLKPDFLLTVNGAGLDNEGVLAYFCAYLGIPLVLWFVDEPFLIPEWGEKFFPQSTVAFTFDRFYETRLKAWGIPWVHTLPLGANHERIIADAGFLEQSTPSYNVSFVGGLEYEKIQYLLKNIFRLWRSMPTAMVDVMEQAVEQYRLNPLTEAEDVIRSCADRLGVAFEFPDNIVKQMVFSFIDRESSFRLRHEIVEGLKPQEIAVFGEPFWGKLLGQAFYKGSVNYYSDEISRVYNASRINLNISKYQLKTTVNQRVFDCPLANGFLLTDFKEDIEAYFEIDKSVAIYFDRDDLKKKIAFYLDHEKQSRRIVDNAKAVICEKHTYHRRLQVMFQTIEQIRRNGRFRSRIEEVRKRKPPDRFHLFLETLGASRLPDPAGIHTELP